MPKHVTIIPFTGVNMSFLFCNTHVLDSLLFCSTSNALWSNSIYYICEVIQIIMHNTFAQRAGKPLDMAVTKQNPNPYTWCNDHGWQLGIFILANNFGERAVQVKMNCTDHGTRENE